MLSRLHAAPLPLQVFLMVAAAPFVIATVGLTLVPLTVEVALAGVEDAVVTDVSRAVSIVLGIAIACGVVAAAGAALLLRSSIAAVVHAMREATDAIAGGRFAHRIGAYRRDELGDLALSVDSMAAQLEHLEAARRRLLATVSHELRTPLTVIRGHAWTLARSESDPARRERFALVDRESERLAALIDDLLDAASLHAGGLALHLRRCDFGVIAADAADRFRSDAATRDVQIVVERSGRPAAGIADPERVHQLLANLIANAVSHAPSGSTVKMAIVHSGSHGVVRATVGNAGPGIPSGTIDEIFEPFVQGERRTGRVGLGLSIAAQLARAHRGSITCHSRDGWTEFEVLLPTGMHDAHEPPVSKEAARTARSAPMGRRLGVVHGR